MHVAIERLRLVRDGRRVLDIPAVEFPSGTTTAVFGPNGAGKTTLLRVLAGLESAAAPSLRIDGAQLPRGQRPPVGLAFQQPVFLRGTVRENLLLALRLRGVPAADRAPRVAEVATECGIDAVLDRRADRLSAGEAQRANLARALALRAPLTLLDEPLTGVDHATRTALLHELPRLLAEFATTSVIVTHDRQEAFRLAERLVILIDGQVRAAGAKGEVYSHPPDAACAALLNRRS